MEYVVADGDWAGLGWTWPPW